MTHPPRCPSLRLALTLSAVDEGNTQRGVGLIPSALGDEKTNCEATVDRFRLDQQALQSPGNLHALLPVQSNPGSLVRK